MLFAVYLLTDTLNWYRLGVLVFLLNLRSTKRNKSRISNPKRFKFSRKGPIKNMACLRWFPKANRAWENSYLCAEGKNDDVKDGKWSDWRPWAKCTMSCGGGEQQRRRTCSNSFPQNGGKMVAGRRGPGGVGAAGHVLKAFSFVVEHVRTQHQEMAVECALG
ncbi:hypothetical protein QZH41_004400 [Actinostola sp. cb2023]|nr:hypothetical protein QZH41_004400 [Actinostola sp. cb2023]